MIRNRVVTSLRALAISLGAKSEGSQWHLFGSVNRNEQDAADIDLMIFCKSDDQADAFRRVLDPDALELPLHLSLMTFEEAAEINAASVQCSRTIFP